MARLELGMGVVDQPATNTLRRNKLTARNKGDFSSALYSAGYYAKKLGHTMYVYSGNSYGHAVWRVSDKSSEYLDPINNTGARVVSVDPDLQVAYHNLAGRGDAAEKGRYYHGSHDRLAPGTILQGRRGEKLDQSPRMWPMRVEAVFERTRPPGALSRRDSLFVTKTVRGVYSKAGAGEVDHD